MSSSKCQAAAGRLLDFLREWDRGNKVVRRRMLQTFLLQNTGKTSPELELEFSQAASLFLARICAWMRLTYMFGTCLDLQLKALKVFLSATSNHRYLLEFLEVGGMMTLLEVLKQDRTKEGEKAEALQLLSIIANTGYKYKEVVCESYGVKVVAECLVKSRSEETQRSAINLLESLAHGNLRYQKQVYKGLIALLACRNPTAQQLVLHTLRKVQTFVKSAHPAIVEPLLDLLRSFHLEVQCGAIELIIELQQTEVRDVLLSALLALLKPTRDGTHKHKILQDPEMIKMTEPLPVYVQQAAAAKTLRMLAEGKRETSEELVQRGVVHHLLYAMGNQEHAEAQIQASLALEHFVRSYPEVEEQVRSAMGSDLFNSFMHNAELLYISMDEVQADILLSNKVEVSSEMKERTAATEEDADVRTYAVWVSEVMLQQTQVATVIDYYNRWMKKWPTVQELAGASLEEVNQMWSGLGYYSRGRRLHEGAQKVVRDLDGKMPKNAEDLLKQLPGVGRYTAGAISSISLGEVTGVVDGNVTRVLCRVRAIGADSTSTRVTVALWKLAGTVVDPERPGDFNQAMMELGATVCTPKSPLCTQCPVESHCHANRKVRSLQQRDSQRLLGKSDSTSDSPVPDIENCLSAGHCKLCLSEDWNTELGVQNFPQKPVKKAPRVERTLVYVLQRQSNDGETQFLLTQRPSTGLLAGMWELPSVLLEEGVSEKKHRDLLNTEMKRILGRSPPAESFQYVGEVVHIFSHIHQTYVVYSAAVCVSTDEDKEQKICWLTRSALQEAAVSSGVRKIIKLYSESTNNLDTNNLDTKNKKQISEAGNSKKTKQSRKRGANNDPKQLSLSQFFTSSKQTRT
ncbi:uncharacterized protein LOC134317972 [Trichomycterus rosablanca]|uniref:uncharacterized protein LOC134317972 n=1 Tax=Trichomycterus rosablanca TaxID=2290929 RepID=UPI002F3561FE